ncbi:hypothetical protein HanXRQr2_Chr12g0563241 [Helianthus annuus]|uniref:Uncharacterized protein n=1 Tax=Helianthus annuus TaxID=4232 RepID=A0A9K3HK53_HELAN|nr:hypothetical protein HanXRQr2_Chr12g0563241 [Helianthus annuus]KAJ0676567.1 hypothetical protein HanLR1_Chr12g0464211 [Helianthus annuus]KAJ0679771.1 hypothetical protein HanOQP8_Chr12g0463371 [Helianthus annuus]KAJ0864510.1 hypothetical protein HanPSC8_Chr12g0542771 [Helianthus annuus]
METTNQPISSSSPSSGDDDPPPADDVTFRFNQKLTLISELDANDDSNPQQLIPEASETDDGPISSSPPAADDVTFPFNQLQINGNNYDSKISNPQNLIPEASETEDDDEEDEEEDDGDFTFMYVADNGNGNGSLTAFENGQIRNVFPLFDQSLLLTGDYDDGNRRFPIDVPVDKVFIESPRRSPSDNGETDGSVRRLPIEVPVDKVFIESPRRSSSDNGETDGTGTGTLRRLQNESEINKSNSTGFSKLWRFRNNEMNRSNSDGRDAFVFLESSDTGTTATTSDGKPNGVKVNVGKGKGVKKGKKSTASAHEVYLKQKGGQTEEERRRSYLPYRPGLMGFFTNVNGGLSKNVHPF